MRVLLAGCGDLGQRLGLRLAAQGHEVFGLRRRIEALPPDIRGLRADLNRMESLDGLPADLGAVVCTLTPDSRDPEGYRRAYVEAPRNLVRALGAQQPTWVFASSTAVYGGDFGGLVDDDTPARPEGFNGEILLEAEQSLAQAVPHLRVLRFSGLYGPGREMLLRRARAGGTCEPRWGNRIHVEDAVSALALALSAPDLPAVCIASDGTPAREDEVLAWLAARLGCAAPRCAPGIERGRRILPRRLQAAGFSPRYADFRFGYSSLLQASG